MQRSQNISDSKRKRMNYKVINSISLSEIVAIKKYQDNWWAGMLQLRGWCDSDVSNVLAIGVAASIYIQSAGHTSDSDNICMKPWLRLQIMHYNLCWQNACKDEISLKDTLNWPNVLASVPPSLTLSCNTVSFVVCLNNNNNNNNNNNAGAYLQNVPKASPQALHYNSLWRHKKTQTLTNMYLLDSGGNNKRQCYERLYVYWIMPFYKICYSACLRNKISTSRHLRISTMHYLFASLKQYNVHNLFGLLNQR